MNHKEIFNTNGLNCTNCAAKIEDELKKKETIKTATVDLIKEEIAIEYYENSESLTEGDLQGIVDGIEKGVVVYRGENEKMVPSRSLYITLAVSAVLLVFTLIFHSLPPLALVIVRVAATLLAGYDALIKAFQSLRRLILDENVLVIIAVIAAFLIGESFEALVVLILFRLGSFIEGATLGHSRNAIKKLLEIRPDTARIKLNDGTYKEISAKEVEVGTTILLNPYERLALDGVVIQGEGSVDGSAVTGESLLIDAAVGTPLWSGMICLENPLHLKTTELFDSSAASKIVELVKNSVAKKAKTEDYITRFAKIFVPIILVLAVLIVIFTPKLLGITQNEAIYHALVVLVSSCPCAMVLSVPMGFFASIGVLSKHGVLCKGGKYLEVLAKSKSIAFDKTGTLTENELEVTEIIDIGGVGEDNIISLAAALEQHSSHPIAKTVMKAARGMILPLVHELTERAGYGISATVNGKNLLCGSAKLLQNEGVGTGDIDANLYLSFGKSLLGAIKVSGKVVPGASDMIRELKSDGIEKVIMLSGDNQKTANQIGEEVGIDEVYAPLLPDEKLTKLSEIKKKYKSIIYVGDGINDAPVIAAADLGVAMGFGSDIAIDTAEIVLVKNNLSILPKARKLAFRALSVIRFNLWFALNIKALFIILGMFGHIDMWWAVFADVGVSIITLLNATRILKFKAE